MDDLTFLPFNAAYIPALHAACWPAVAEDHIQRFFAYFLKMNGQGRAWGIVALVGGEVVGFGQVTRWRDRGEISDVVISETWRGRGFGGRLVERLVEIARENGFDEVDIGAAESNTRAVELYRRIGFTEARHRLMDIGNGVEPVIYMTLDLKDGAGG